MSEKHNERNIVSNFFKSAGMTEDEIVKTNDLITEILNNDVEEVEG